MGTDVNVAVAGATGAVGGEVLKLLDAAKWRPERVTPLARSTTSTTHVEYGGERLPVDDADAELDGVDALVVAVPASAAAPIVARGVSLGVPTVDLSAADPTIPLVVPWVNPEALLELPRSVLAIPDPAATLIASVLGPLRRAGVEGLAEALVMVPASREGKAGIEELSRQVIALFNTQTPPRKVWKDGLAFDLLPALGTPDGSGWTDREREVGQQLARLGVPAEVTLVGVPVFSGMSAQITLRPSRRVPVELALRVLSDGGARMPEAGGVRYLPRPRRVEGQAYAHVGRVRATADGSGLVVWAAMDNLRTSAAAAVAALGTLLRAGRGEA